MLKGFFLYVMPTYITLVELLIKYLLSFVPGRQDPVELALSGPSLAVAGITLLLPVPIAKPSSIVMAPATGGEAVIIINRRDQQVIETATVLLFVLLPVWGGLLYVAHQTNPSILVFVVGIVIYVIGVAMTRWKEMV